MVFSSHVFLFWFLPCALVSYYLSPKAAKPLALTLCSFVFYGWSNPLFTILMLLCIAVNYAAGLVIVRDSGCSRTSSGEFSPLTAGALRSRRQRVALIASMAISLGMLGFFKYWNFGIENFERLMDAMGLATDNGFQAVHVVLPLGISFYTFQAMSYTIDVYRGNARAITDFTRFACYVSMFPQLVAGPIVRYQDVADQLFERTHTLDKFTRGLAYLIIGLSQKILLANPCGRIADTCFNASSRDMLEAWTGLFAYSFQIYFDFSGYSNMAIGLGLMLGFTFRRNFNSPYRACGIADFWRRWHISLSTWLRDYFYIPLGGNRKGPVRTYINLMLVMLIGGLWHGASWNFVFWGAGHGLWLALERLLSRRISWRPHPLAASFITFIGVSLLWVPFRAADFGATLDFYQSLFARSAGDGHGLVGAAIGNSYLMLSLGIAAIVVFAAPPAWRVAERIGPIKAILLLLALIGCIALLSSQSYNPFIYFIF
ncbi:MAG: MBOAT family O-acyltransferase [Luteolibacter sp.]